MRTVARRPTPTIDPQRLYSFEELGELSGLGRHAIKREVVEGRMGYVQVAPERGRRVEGQQFLDWKDANRCDPAEA